MNGQERAEENYRTFQKWIADKTDADFREMVMQGRLNRGEICRECGFGRSALVQNPRIKEALHEIEARLRRDGVLPEFAASGDALPLRANGQVQASSDAERLKRLEAENAGLRAELAMLREQLSRFQAIDTLLAETGRLAR